jgi:hypothetical protein
MGVPRRSVQETANGVSPGLPDQVGRIGGGPNHVETAVGEAVHDSLAHDGLVLADDYPDRCGLGNATKLRGCHWQPNGVAGPFCASPQAPTPGGAPAGTVGISPQVEWG